MHNSGSHVFTLWEGKAVGRRQTHRGQRHGRGWGGWKTTCTTWDSVCRPVEEGKPLSGTAGGTGRLLARDIDERKRQAAHGSCSRPLTVHLGHVGYTEPHGPTPISPTHWLTDPEHAPETTAPQAPCEQQRTQGSRKLCAETL